MILELLEKLVARQDAFGLWGYQANQACVESACLAILALRHWPGPEIERAAQALQGLQNRNGSWPSILR